MYTILQILAEANIASEARTKGGTVVRLTAGNQLIGTYSELSRYRDQQSPLYNGWEAHHIFEALDVERLGLTPFAPVYEQQICVLLPKEAHHRVNSVLRRANPTRLSAIASELEPAYRDAYAILGNYCGSSEAAVHAELFGIFQSVLRNMVGEATSLANGQIARARSELEKLLREIRMDKGWHEQLVRGSSASPLETANFVASMLNPLTAAAALANPQNRAVIGAAVDLLNPSGRPELSIWDRAEEFAREADRALQRRDMVAATAAIANANAHFEKARTAFRGWRDGIDLAGRRAEIVIAAAAVAASMVAIGAFAVEATAAAGTAATATTAAAGQTTTGVRIAREVVEATKGIMQATTLQGEQVCEQRIRVAIGEVAELVVDEITTETPKRVMRLGH